MYDYDPALQQWRAVHLFHWDYWQVHYPPEEWVAKMIAIELEWQRIEARLVRKAVATAKAENGEAPNEDGAVTVYDKAQGGFLGHDMQRGAQAHVDKTPTEEFAERAQRPAMTTRELRQRLAELHDQQAAKER